ncbi:Cof-type HAD-IIB family hydrolase [Arcicella aquatica]|uniref:Cof-type HAD-IIB family hydrolase n=1 Tax=Arcicella aquatica TaxID=217141 RepID=A0ABU5QTI9_9BACT|nr:Cof-type HAD-IIB family hydrolase [Arcicella aquatica]MEA5260411.1 Cof-type HAD-IIB family hydrolase [Arcicella aquatica]
MKYKMLVLDMDDTLLSDEHLISDKNKEMILKAQEKGVYVVLASGRPTPAMTTYAKDLSLDTYGSYILSYNGGVITDMANNEILFEQSISTEHIHELYDFSVENNVHILAYHDGAIITESASEYIDLEARLTGMPLRKVANFKEAITAPSVKCLMLEEPEYLASVGAKLKAQINHKSITTSKPFFLEIMQKGIDKAASLARLAERLNIHADEIIAVGNANNDLSMIEYAGLGVWVDNVTPEIRHKADVIVASNNDNGVAEVIERFILN